MGGWLSDCSNHGKFGFSFPVVFLSVMLLLAFVLFCFILFFLIFVYFGFW